MKQNSTLENVSLMRQACFRHARYIKNISSFKPKYRRMQALKNNKGSNDVIDYNAQEIRTHRHRCRSVLQPESQKILPLLVIRRARVSGGKIFPGARDERGRTGHNHKQQEATKQIERNSSLLRVSYIPY
jgi:hypothetical protein